MRVFMILQKQLDEIYQEGRLLATSIQRIDAKQWLPLFDVKGADGKKITCSLQIQAHDAVRTWADLRLLAEWLRDRYGVMRCTLVLNDFEMTQPG